MANGTPSNTIPLGSALLEAMGDAKGAMKALGDEAKNAKADARSAQNDLKQAERDAKRAQAAIDKVKSKGGTVTQDQKTEAKRLNNLVDDASKKAMEKQTIVTEKNVKREGLKAQQKVERDRIKNMNQFEKRVNGKITGVRDTLHGVGAKLSNSNVPALKKAGKKISEAAGTLTPGIASQLAKVGGQVLRGAGIAAAGVTGGIAVAKAGETLINRNLEEIKVRGTISNTMTAAMRAFAGKTVSGADANLISSGLKAQADAARKQIESESFTAKIAGTSGFLAEVFGTSATTAKRQKALGDLFLDNAQISERFGADVADKLNVVKIAKSKGVSDVIQRNIDKSLFRGGINTALGDTTFTSRVADGLLALGYETGLVSADNYKKVNDFLNELPTASSGEQTYKQKILSYFYSAEDEAATNLEAKAQREKRIEAIQAELEKDKRKVLMDPDGASKRKQSAIRDQSIESERIRRNMQTARF